MTRYFAHISAAGMLMCAWLESMARYVPSMRSPYTRYFTVTLPSARHAAGWPYPPVRTARTPVGVRVPGH